MLGFLKCKVGSHEWENWTYRADGSCAQRRACVRCGVEEPGEDRHQFETVEYVKEESCMRQRVCVRCGRNVFAGVRHEWGEWSEVETSCEKSRGCRRCRERQSEPGHTWGEGRPMYAELDGLSYVCGTETVCTRCGASEKNETWSEADERRMRMSYL